MVLNKLTTARGFSLVELLVTAAVMLIVFGGLFGGFRYTLDVISNSRAKLSALTLANERMEYIRSLSYDAVGTVSGLPNGALPQVSTSSLNGIIFTQTVLIQYVDDAADGIGVADSNMITTDYKVAKVTIGWSVRGVAKEIFLVSTIIPRSIETNVGGGTVRVNVFDANLAPLPGADVRLLNTTGTSTVDVTRSSDATGVALFGGAPAGSNYQIFVTALGYSSEQTYVATTTLPNPTTAPISVTVANISTVNFFIDRLSSLTITTLLNKTASTSVFTFSDLSQIASSSAVTTAASSLTLTSSAGLYSATGFAYLNPITPAVIDSWDTFTLVATTTALTTVHVSFYTGTSTYTLISDSDLPGNSAGFSGSTISLAALNSVAYPSLVPRLQLATASSTITPQVGQVSVRYIASKTIAPNVALGILGAKTIGTLADTSPVYKYNKSTTTNGSGVRTIANIEYDAYTIAPTGYDVSEACPSNPVAVLPNSVVSLELILAADTSDSFRVSVVTAAGASIPGATVTLDRSGYNQTRTTSACGQVFFSGLTANTDYTLTIVASGYTTQTFTSVSIGGDATQKVTF